MTGEEFECTDPDCDLCGDWPPHEEKPMIENAVVADEMIRRLNVLIEQDESVRRDVGHLIESRVPCSDAVGDHPTIQVSIGADQKPSVGFLGLLNGLIGAIGPGHKRAGWGHVAMRVGDDGTIARFVRTEEIGDS